jgi:mRNA-degrading endonuclease RelE of RelBE toxin-antitoxin system
MTWKKERLSQLGTCLKSMDDPAVPWADLSTLYFTKTAQKDIKRIRQRNPREFSQIAQDIRRLAQECLPPAGRKKLKTFHAWQMDAGRFRIVYHPSRERTVILAVFAKHEQRDRLRHF